MHVTLEEETETGRKELLATSKEDVRIDLTLSFIRLLKKAKEWRREFQNKRIQTAVIVRNPHLVNNHENFLKLVKAGKYSPGDYFKFVNDSYQDSIGQPRNIFSI